MGKPPMSPQEYAQALAEFNLSRNQACWLFGGKANTRSYSAGWRWMAEGAPYHVALTIALMRKFKLSAKDIERIGAPWRKK